MNRTTGLRPALLALAMVCVPAAAAALPASAPPIDVAALEREIGKTVAEKKLVGLSVGVMQDGRVVLARGYGVRSLPAKDAVTADTLFAVGSLTKQFTCAAFLLLAEDGKLSTGDPVSKYDPSLTRASDVTLLDLGQHVSGFRDYYPLDFVDGPMAKAKPAGEVIAEFATRPLDFPPESRWSYSNTGFLILGAAVEKAAGRPFGEVLAARIFSPLGMRHTLYEPKRGTAGLAEGYTSFALGPPEPAVAEGEGWIGAAGAIWSTPKDLLAWDLALMDGRLLSPDSWRTMTTPRRFPDGRSSGYGCGLGIRDTGPALVYSHGGAVSGFVARNTLLPASRSALVLLANSDFAALEALHDTILKVLLPGATDAPSVKGPPPREAVQAFLRELREGRVDRASLGGEFAAYLTPDKVTAAAATLGPLGEPKGVEVVSVRERGGMELATVAFTLGGIPVEARLFRTPDGKVQQLLVYRR